MNLSALEPIAPLRAAVEILVPVRHRRSRKSLEPSAMDRLIDALESLRNAGLEADLYLRGTWARGGTSVVLRDLQLHGWQIGAGLLVSDGAPTCWHPMPTKRPQPQIVVRGVPA